MCAHFRNFQNVSVLPLDLHNLRAKLLRIT